MSQRQQQRGRIGVRVAGGAAFTQGTSHPRHPNDLPSTARLFQVRTAPHITTAATASSRSTRTASSSTTISRTDGYPAVPPCDPRDPPPRAADAHAASPRGETRITGAALTALRRDAAERRRADDFADPSTYTRHSQTGSTRRSSPLPDLHVRSRRQPARLRGGNGRRSPRRRQPAASSRSPSAQRRRADAPRPWPSNIRP